MNKIITSILILITVSCTKNSNETEGGISWQGILFSIALIIVCYLVITRLLDASRNRKQSKATTPITPVQKNNNNGSNPAQYDQLMKVISTTWKTVTKITTSIWEKIGKTVGPILGFGIAALLLIFFLNIIVVKLGGKPRELKLVGYEMNQETGQVDSTKMIFEKEGLIDNFKKNLGSLTGFNFTEKAKIKAEKEIRLEELRNQENDKRRAEREAMREHRRERWSNWWNGSGNSESTNSSHNESSNTSGSGYQTLDPSQMTPNSSIQTPQYPDNGWGPESSQKPHNNAGGLDPSQMVPLSQFQ